MKIQAEINLKIPQGRTAYELVKSNCINGLSIGYSIKNAHYDPQQQANLITDLKLWEVSIVTFPANEKARIDPTEDTLNQTLDQLINTLNA